MLQCVGTDWNVQPKPDVPDRQYRPKAGRHHVRKEGRTGSPTPFTTSHNVLITRPDRLAGHRYDDCWPANASLRPQSRKRSTLRRTADHGVTTALPAAGTPSGACGHGSNGCATSIRADPLSIGMDDDLALATAEGATMVRVGTAFFGQRDQGFTGIGGRMRRGGTRARIHRPRNSSLPEAIAPVIPAKAGIHVDVTAFHGPRLPPGGRLSTAPLQDAGSGCGRYPARPYPHGHRSPRLTRRGSSPRSLALKQHHRRTLTPASVCCPLIRHPHERDVQHQY